MCSKAAFCRAKEIRRLVVDGREGLWRRKSMSKNGRDKIEMVGLNRLMFKF